MSYVCHPPIDGSTTVINEYWETYLHCFTSKEQHQWEKWLPLAKWWYNNSYHTTSKLTSYEAVYGHAPPVLLPSTPSSSPIQAVDMVIRNKHQILHLLQDNLHLTRAHMKQ